MHCVVSGNNNIVFTILLNTIIIILSSVASLFSHFLSPFPMIFFLLQISLPRLSEHPEFCLIYSQYFIHMYIKEFSTPDFFQIVTSHALLNPKQSLFGIHHSTKIAFIKVSSDPVARLNRLFSVFILHNFCSPNRWLSHSGKILPLPSVLTFLLLSSLWKLLSFDQLLNCQCFLEFDV